MNKKDEAKGQDIKWNQKWNEANIKCMPASLMPLIRRATNSILNFLAGKQKVHK